MILETKVGLDVYSLYTTVRLIENVEVRQNIWTQTTSPTHDPLGERHTPKCPPQCSHIVLMLCDHVIFRPLWRSTFHVQYSTTVEEMGLYVRDILYIRITEEK